jgi:anti-sigma regulatory factor (Ser/Thr protein kinase)
MLELDVTLLPERTALSRARKLVQRWLTDHRWPADQLEDLVFATSEAVANAVEHGYCSGRHSVAAAAHGVIEVCGRVLADRVGPVRRAGRA